MFKKIIVSGLSGFLIAACLAISATSALAKTPSDFSQANKDYAVGKFQEAKQLYEKTVAVGNYSSALFYNLGNADFRLKNPGEAALNYERALMLDPANAEASANLDFVRTQTGARIPQQSWLDTAIAPLSENAYIVIAASAAWAILFLLAFRLFQKRSGWATALSLLSLLVLAYSLMASWQLEKQNRRAIIVSEKTDARFNPEDGAKLAQTLPAGSRVRILHKNGPWVYCRLPDKDRAWVSAKDVRTVRL